MPALQRYRSDVNRRGGSRPIGEQLSAGPLVFLAQPHPICGARAGKARKNAGAIAIRVGLAGILSKATAGREFGAIAQSLSAELGSMNTLVNAVPPCATET